MNRYLALPVAVATCIIVTVAEQAAGADMLVLRSKTSQVSIALGGGGITEFRLAGSAINPLNWEISEDLEPRPVGKPYLRGHFLCLDRWGAPSEAEQQRGVPFHGEAPRVVWEVLGPARNDGAHVAAVMGCTLPLAGIKVRRKVRLAENAALLTVVEEVTNTNKLGRIYNMVQHPTIAPPFLDAGTIVDTNAREGFLQQGDIPSSRASAEVWPTVTIDGRPVDLRRFRDDSEAGTPHDVTSFVFGDQQRHGWVTAVNPGKGLLIGYRWMTDDYPWLNIWRYRFQGRVAARGLEFGTTGYHQPYAVLVQTGKLLQRPLYEYIDAGQTVRKSYAAFLCEVPHDFEGVASVSHRDGRLVIRERRASAPRTVEIEMAGRTGQ